MASALELLYGPIYAHRLFGMGMRSGQEVEANPHVLLREIFVQAVKPLLLDGGGPFGALKLP